MQIVTIFLAYISKSLITITYFIFLPQMVAFLVKGKSGIRKWKMCNARGKIREREGQNHMIFLTSIYVTLLHQKFTKEKATKKYFFPSHDNLNWWARAILVSFDMVDMIRSSLQNFDFLESHKAKVFLSLCVTDPKIR